MSEGKLKEREMQAYADAANERNTLEHAFEPLVSYHVNIRDMLDEARKQIFEELERLERSGHQVPMLKNKLVEWFGEAQSE